MPTSPADLSRLETLAREATPGPWYDASPGAVTCDVPQDVDHEICLGFDEPEYDGKFLLCESVVHPQTRAYIAAANPAAVLALIERVREAEGDAARFRWMARRYDPTDYRRRVDDAIDADMKGNKP